MKILHVIPAYIPFHEYGGPVKGTHDLCRSLLAKKQEVEVFTTDFGLAKGYGTYSGRKLNVDGVRVTYFNIKFPARYFYCPGLFKALKYRVNSFDIVHIHSVFLHTTWAACFWCIKENIPYLINPFGALDPDMISFKSSVLKNLYIRLVEANNIRKASFIHLASEYEEKKIKELNFNTPSVVVPRGIFPEEYEYTDKCNSVEKKYPELKKKKKILFLGRIHPKKGLEDLGQAFKLLLSETDKVRLVIAGTGDDMYVKSIKELYGVIGISDSTVFTGQLQGEEKLALFHESDVFVLPSYGENFGISVLEAMACGLPVIVTDKVGLASEIEKNGAGIVVPKDINKLTGALKKILCDEHGRVKMKQNARDASRKFSMHKIVDDMIDLYRSVVKK